MPIKTTKKQAWFKMEIIKRFMSDRELAGFLEKYEEAKLVNVGRQEIEQKKE